MAEINAHRTSEALSTLARMFFVRPAPSAAALVLLPADAPPDAVAARDAAIADDAAALAAATAHVASLNFDKPSEGNLAFVRALGVDGVTAFSAALSIEPPPPALPGGAAAAARAVHDAALASTRTQIIAKLTTHSVTVAREAKERAEEAAVRAAAGEREAAAAAVKEASATRKSDLALHFTLGKTFAEDEARRKVKGASLFQLRTGIRSCPDGEAWLAANERSETFHDDAAAIILKELGVTGFDPSRVLGVPGGPTTADSDHGSSSVVDLAALPDHRLAGTHTSLPAAAAQSAAVRATLAPFQAGRCPVSALLDGLLACHAVTGKSKVPVSGTLVAVSEPELDEIGRTVDYGIMGLLRTNPAVADSFVLGIPAAFLKVMEAVTFTEAPPVGSTSTAPRAPDARKDLKGAQRTAAQGMAAVAAMRFLRERHALRDVRAMDFDYNALAFEKFLRQLATSTTVRLEQARSLCADVSMSVLFYDPREEQAEVLAVISDLLTTSFAGATAACKALYTAAGGAKPGLDAVAGGGPNSYPVLRLNAAECAAALANRATEHGMSLSVRAALSAASAGGSPARAPLPPPRGGAGGGSMGGAPPLPKNEERVLSSTMTRIGLVKDPSIRIALGGDSADTKMLATVPTEIFAAAVGTSEPVILCFRQFKLGSGCAMVQGPCPLPPPHAGGRRLWHISPASLTTLQAGIVWSKDK